MGYRDLDAWKRAMDLAVEVYESTKEFPQEEQFGLTSQIRRASVSIAANVAEGYGRRSPGDYARFLRTAKGSTNELETLLILSNRLDFLKHPDELLEMTNHVGSMLTGLIRSVEGGVVREISSMYAAEDEQAFDD